jgi:hypothetical protein
VLVAVAVTGTPVPHDTPAPAFVSVDVLMPLVLDVAVADEVRVFPAVDEVVVLLEEEVRLDVAVSVASPVPFGSGPPPSAAQPTPKTIAKAKIA